MVGLYRIVTLLTLTSLLLTPAHGSAAPQNARYNWEKTSSKTSSVAKNGKKKPVTSKKSSKSIKSKSPVYTSIGSKKSSKTTYKKKTKYVPPAKSVSLPRPDKPVSTGDFITEVASPSDPRLERAYIQQLSANNVVLPRMPNFSTSYRGRVAGLSEGKEFIQYTIDPELQAYAKSVISKASATHIAMVAMEPTTGRILAIAGKSPTLQSAATHAGYPAASLIKVVTTAAALEHASMDPATEIAFRGGTYELSPLNFDPRPGFDKRVMSVSEALGRSCNPVFSRVALQFLNPSLLRYETAAFGFNSDLKMQVPLTQSVAVVPNNDYDFGRTAAGFGDVYLSPIHAATIISTLANKGMMPRPSIIDQIASQTGEVLYQFAPTALRQSVRPDTAQTLLHMMTATTTIGTSKREFEGKVPWEVPAKTGTLKGVNPKGLNNWFIGVAPMNNPKIAVSVVVVNPLGTTAKASHLGRLLLEKYLG